MKKILFALVAIALVFVSCKKTEEQKKETTPFSISMSVAGTPTATTADILCVPNTDTLYYFAAYAPKASASELTAADLADYAYQMIEVYASYGYEFEDIAYAGEQTISCTGLTPETQYIACATQIDEKSTVYKDMFTCDFTTGVMPQTTMTIAIAYDGDTTVTFTPSQTADKYGLYVETQADYDKYFDEWNEESWAEELEAWASTYAYYGYEFPTYSGTQTVSINDFSSEAIAAGTDMCALAAPMVSGIVNGTANAIQFVAGAPAEARRNVPARAPKAMFRMARR